MTHKSTKEHNGERTKCGSVGKGVLDHPSEKKMCTELLEKMVYRDKLYPGIVSFLQVHAKCCILLSIKKYTL